VGQRTAKIVFAGGGTGGHLVPALVVAEALRRRRPAAEISFIGARRGLERSLVPRSGFPLRTLRLSALKGRSTPARIVAAVEAGLAVFRCAAWMVRSRPGLVIGVGGYASGPAVLAAGMLRIKTMVLEQNHFPGATNRWLASRVDAVCLPSEEARERLGGLGIVTGNPVREEFFAIAGPPAEPALSVLAFGGSRGARSINRAMTEALDSLSRLPHPPRIVHQTGVDDETVVREAYAAYPRDRSEIHTFLDDMPGRLAAADIVVCRAGATTMAELTAGGRGALLVPYPFAADDHQWHNAETLRRAGAAEVVRDAELTGRRIAEFVVTADADRKRVRAMGRAARELARPDATDRICDVAERLLGSGVNGGGDVS